MPIPKLNKECHAFFILQTLPSTHGEFVTLVERLRDTNHSFSTVELISYQQRHKDRYHYIKDFWDEENVWFTGVFPDWAVVIPGYLTSMEVINTAIHLGLTNHYWDTELNTAVMINISQTHRNALADVIEGELEP